MILLLNWQSIFFFYLKDMKALRYEELFHTNALLSLFLLYSNGNFFFATDFKGILIWKSMKQGHTLVSPLNLIENCPLLPEGLILIAQEQTHRLM